MENRKALIIIEMLAEGVDPTTGEVLPDSTALQKPDVIRALYAARNSLINSCKRERRKQTLPDNTGKPWLLDEDEKLTRLFKQGSSIMNLSDQHKRTNGGIRARLEKLGLIT